MMDAGQKELVVLAVVLVIAMVAGMFGEPPAEDRVVVTAFTLHSNDTVTVHEVSVSPGAVSLPESSGPYTVSIRGDGEMLYTTSFDRRFIRSPSVNVTQHRLFLRLPYQQGAEQLRIASGGRTLATTPVRADDGGRGRTVQAAAGLMFYLAVAVVLVRRYRRWKQEGPDRTGR